MFFCGPYFPRPEDLNPSWNDVCVHFCLLPTLFYYSGCVVNHNAVHLKDLEIVRSHRAMRAARKSSCTWDLVLIL